MLPITFYRCEKCKRDYNNMEDAEKCENGHLTIVETRIKGYGLYPHPYEIDIVFSNGDVIRYVAEYLRG